MWMKRGQNSFFSRRTVKPVYETIVIYYYYIIFNQRMRENSRANEVDPLAGQGACGTSITPSFSRKCRCRLLVTPCPNITSNQIIIYLFFFNFYGFYRTTLLTSLQFIYVSNFISLFFFPTQRVVFCRVNSNLLFPFFRPPSLVNFRLDPL